MIGRLWWAPGVQPGSTHHIYKPHFKAQYLSGHQISDRKLGTSVFLLMTVHTGRHMLSARTVGSVSLLGERAWTKPSLVQSHPCCLLGSDPHVRDTASVPLSWRQLVGTAQSRASGEANRKAICG